MKTINYKGVELEVMDSTVIHTYGNRGNAEIEFNKMIYKFEGETFYSLGDVDKYLGKRKHLYTYKGFDIYRILGKDIITHNYGGYIVYVIKDKSDDTKFYKVQKTVKDAIEFIDELLKKQKETSQPIPSNDNRLTIKMLNSVSEILSAIESNDADLIQLNLTELEERLDKFKNVYYDNKRNGVYE